MIRKNRKAPRLGLYLRLHKDGEVYTHRRQSLKAFFNLCKASLGDRYDISVTYYPRVKNEGTYKTKKEMLFALRAFTNSEELDFIEQYWR